VSAGDAIIRALGADPAVYRPVARAHARILSRRTRLARGTGRVITKGITPFQFRCFMFVVFSLIMLPWIVGAASPIFGVALVLTAGAGFLILDLLFDKFDVLADADEYQVIAAHPHDAWSVILAKIVALGRSVAALAACTFLIPAIGVGFAFHSVAAGIAFAVGAAALSIAVSAGGMLVSALVVASGGRRALLRFLPVAHAVYLIIYLGIFFARGALARVSMPRIESLGWVQWALPTVWFAAPVELASGHAGPMTAARGSLALASFAVLLPISAHWVRARFDERILEPARVRVRTKPRPKTAEAGARAHTSGVPSARVVGMRAYWRILVAHLRSDTTVRGGIIMAFLMPGMIMASQIFGMHMIAEGVIAMSMTWLIMAEVNLVRASVMSSRPSAIWFVLVAPGACVPYSRALETLVRIAVILPAVTAATAYSIVAGSGPMWIRLALVALVAIVSDSALLMLRIMTPDPPFSQPVRSKRPFRWGAVLIGLAMFGSIGLLLGGFLFLERWHPGTCVIPVVYAAAARVGIGFWAKNRVERRAREVEAV
jgi:hypothetical protein